jgi:putative transposase
VACGVPGLTDRSRRPYRYAHQLPFQVENYILNVKREHTTWGAHKIRERLIRRFLPKAPFMRCWIATV